VSTHPGDRIDDVLPVTCAGAAALLVDAVPPPAVRRLTMFWGLSPPYPSSGETMVVLRGTESLLTHPWRKPDWNRWSPSKTERLSFALLEIVSRSARPTAK